MSLSFVLGKKTTDHDDFGHMFKFGPWYALKTDNSYIGIKSSHIRSSGLGKAHFKIVTMSYVNMDNYPHLKENCEGFYKSYNIIGDFNRSDIKLLNTTQKVYGVDWIYVVHDPKNVNFYGSDPIIYEDYVLINGHVDKPLSRNFDALRQIIASVRNRCNEDSFIKIPSSSSEGTSSSDDDLIPPIAESNSCYSPRSEPNKEQVHYEIIDHPFDLYIGRLTPNFTQKSLEKIAFIYNEILDIAFPPKKFEADYANRFTFGVNHVDTDSKYLLFFDVSGDECNVLVLDFHGNDRPQSIVGFYVNPSGKKQRFDFDAKTFILEAFNYQKYGTSVNEPFRKSTTTPRKNKCSIHVLTDTGFFHSVV